MPSTFLLELDAVYIESYVAFHYYLIFIFVLFPEEPSIGPSYPFTFILVFTIKSLALIINTHSMLSQPWSSANLSVYFLSLL